MPEMAVGRPLDKADLRNERRFQPLHLPHLLQRDPATPVGRFAIRQVAERTPARMEREELSEHFPPHVPCEPGAHLSSEPEVLSVVVG